MEAGIKTCKDWSKDASFVGMNIVSVNGPIAVLWDKQPVSKEDFLELVKEFCKVEWSLSRL